MKPLIGFFLSAVCCCAAAADEQVEVRVRQTPGGPQIFVDGTPVPPHMFWGREIVAEQPVSGEWRRFRISHTPAATVENAEVRFAYQPVAGSVEVRNFSFGAATNLSWRIERKATDTAMWKAVRAGRLEKGVRYDMSFEARGDGIAWIRPGVEQLEDGPYRYHFVQVPPDDPALDTLVQQSRLAIAAGVRMVTFYAPNCWMPDGAENWEPLDRIFRKLIALDPGVLIIPRVTLNAPEWWQKAHPDDCMVMEDGKPCGYACVSSRAYRRDACAYVERICRHMMEKYPRNFAGIHPTGQNSNEWFYKLAWEKFSGYDPATRDAFRAYLAAKGEPDAATATVPTAQERLLEAPDSLFWDPVKDRRLVDFNTFLQEEMCELVAAIDRTCRRATEGKKLVMSFYGYAWSFSAYARGPAASGHYALARLLEKAGDSIDILSAPISYHAERGWLGSTPHVSAVETLERNGILWIAEDDTVTHRNLDCWYEGYKHRGSSAFTPGQTYDILRRNLAAQAVRNTGSWWMDLYGWNWYCDPRMWQIVTDFKGLDARMCTRSTPYAPDVALFADEPSMMYLRPKKYVGDREKPLFSSPWNGLFAYAFPNLARIGVSYGQYLVDDALKRPVDAKVQILPVFYADGARAAALEKMREGAPDVTRVWCWAPAALSPKGGVDLEQMKRVTGFSFRRVDGFGVPVRSSPAGLAAGLPPEWANYWKRGISPRFAVETEPGDEVWATWEDGSAAVVVRPHGKGNEVFSGAIELPREFLAAIVKRAGVFVSLERPEKATLWRTDGLLSIQAMEDGEQVLLFPRPSTVRDGLTGEVLGGDVVRLPVSMRRGEVRVFAVEAAWRPRERWRGFNIYDKAKKGSFSGVWRESDMRMIHEFGFNFARVMIDYRFWCRDDDWTKPDPAKFPAIDEIIGWGRKYHVHTQICFSTPPGINHETRSKERLFFDPVAQEAMETHWRYFARRYRDLPNDEVTFNLFNEPTAEATEESYTALVKKLVAAIHAEDPKRFIVIDGLLWGRRPLLGAIGLPVGQSHHAYVPATVSHYKAGWIKGSDSWSVPTWPPSPAVSPLFGSRKPEDKQRPFVVNDVKAGTLVLNVKLVNREAELIVEADGQPLFSRLYRPSPGESCWTNLVARDGGREWAGRLVEPIRIAVPDCRRLSVRLGRGDWMEMDSLELSSGGKTVSLPFVSDWQVLRHELRFAGFESPQPFLLADGSAYTGDTYLDDATSVFWKPVLDAGQFVMVGETGAFNKTPHDVSLRWLEDNLRRWKEKGIGWTMWNFRGEFGILDSNRADVKYEDYRGHKLDRKMLELLQRY